MTKPFDGNLPVSEEIIRLKESILGFDVDIGQNRAQLEIAVSEKQRIKKELADLKRIRRIAQDKLASLEEAQRKDARTETEHSPRPKLNDEVTVELPGVVTGYQITGEDRNYFCIVQLLEVNRTHDPATVVVPCSRIHPARKPERP